MSELKQTAFGLGYSARERGDERASVPFPANTFGWLEWLSGYDMAFDVAEIQARPSKADAE